MIIVTGAAGFIGANLVRALNARGERDIVAVDNLSNADKFVNLVDCDILDYFDKNDFLERLERFGNIEAILHQGACSDTMERDGRYMMENNFRYSMTLLRYANTHGVPFIYASSASVYGASRAFAEDPEHERPLNVYGYSKYLFDQHVRRRLPSLASQVVGLRYFNVYGPGEAHKRRMASVAFHAWRQYVEQGQVSLFEGSGGYEPGGQQRDFVHVDDVVAVNLWFLEHRVSGIYNCGTGRAQPFNDVATTVVNTMRRREGQPELALGDLVDSGAIRYIPFPEALKGKYQSYTQSDDTRLRAAGYDAPFMTVQQGVSRYVDWLVERSG